MELILKRQRSDANGTFGILYCDNAEICVTCEDPWNDNRIGSSCIPSGTYQCVKYSSTKFPDVWEILDVPGRIAILIHNGNTIKDTHGCILVGDSFGTVAGLPAVINSVNALKRLKELLPDNFTLTIQ